jgi:hypothetical protein
MNIIVLIVLGGLIGWLTGKAVEVEGQVKVVSEGWQREVQRWCSLSSQQPTQSLLL